MRPSVNEVAESILHALSRDGIDLRAGTTILGKDVPVYGSRITDEDGVIGITIGDGHEFFITVVDA